jgi:hypothetical protein
MDAFANQQTDFRRRTRDLLDPDNDAWALRVFLYPESATVLIPEELAGRLHEGLKVVYGPVGLPIERSLNAPGKLCQVP